MFKLPSEFSEIISAFSPLFSKTVFARSEQLLLGTILTHGKRTVCGVLRTLGLKDITNWDLYHRVLSRAQWSSLKCSQQLLGLLLSCFFPISKTIVFGLDDTLERRWGRKIKAKGIYHDAVRSSKSFFVKCSGLRWISIMLLTHIQWADKSIARTTPVLMGLFSIITLWASKLVDKQKFMIFQTTWYQKSYPTFSDALASVRYRIWQCQVFSQSIENPYSGKTYQSLINHLAFMAARAT